MYCFRFQLSILESDEVDFSTNSSSSSKRNEYSSLVRANTKHTELKTVKRDLQKEIQLSLELHLSSSLHYTTDTESRWQVSFPDSPAGNTIVVSEYTNIYGRNYKVFKFCLCVDLICKCSDVSTNGF